MSALEAYGELQRLAQKGDADKLLEFGHRAADMYPDNPDILCIMAAAYADRGQHYMAGTLFRRVLEIAPDTYEVWNSLGREWSKIAEGVPEYETKCREAFQQEIDNHPENANPWTGLSFYHLQRGEFEQAGECAKKALKLDPESSAAIFNLGIAMLALHMWEEGWWAYAQNLAPRYNNSPPPDRYNLPKWEGQKGKVIVQAEQGMGDEIMFSSMIPDLMKTNDVIIDTAPRLKGLFERSFGVPVFPTRYGDPRYWLSGSNAEYWIPMGDLGQFYRTKAEDFPGTPYLKADPQRRLQWRTLLDSMGTKPKIGVAWTGGVPATGKMHRSLRQFDLDPLLEFDADWINLEYKKGENPDCVHLWPHATLTQDYDDTAALVAELDLVISVTTTVIHCAGALGVKTWCLVPDRPTWRYGTSGARMPWYDSVEMLRKDGEWPMEELRKRLSAMGLSKMDRASLHDPFVLEAA